MRISAICAPSLACGLAWPVAAQTTQTYTYDANGRLVGVTTSGSSGTNSASYTYDDANNRTYRGQSGVTAWAALRRLPVDQRLRPDQALTSPDGRYSLALRSSGQIELWTASLPVPSELASAFEVSGEGEARFLPPAGLDARDALLALASDGALVVLDDADRVLWRSDVVSNAEAGK